MCFELQSGYLGGSWDLVSKVISKLVGAISKYKYTCLLYNSCYYSLLQQPGPKKFKLSKIELIYKAKKFKVSPFTI